MVAYRVPRPPSDRRMDPPEAAPHDGGMSSPSAHPPHELGLWGEECAARHLARDGWEILARNVRWGRREVDLVARRDRTIAFVEVKTRAGRGYGAPQEAVTRLKRREIEAVARYYLALLGHPDVDVRFDVIAIVVDRWRRIVGFSHIEDAWRPGW